MPPICTEKTLSACWCGDSGAESNAADTDDSDCSTTSNNSSSNYTSTTDRLQGFFRRSIQQKIQYRPCTKNQQCNILRINRNRCQYCRLRKCISVGMSRDGEHDLIFLYLNTIPVLLGLGEHFDTHAQGFSRSL